MLSSREAGWRIADIVVGEATLLIVNDPIVYALESHAESGRS